ncbi:porin [Sphingomonas naphthae]|uniref:Porin n=1 Tax=Sphingomonas naphthae TaxID=1813468 RepID=A0ABY7TLQ0_9SPHN|nr:porin [Sphingomonas naphthae]WCT73169.1 porin [Sphingomonas naphthae]
MTTIRGQMGMTGAALALALSCALPAASADARVPASRLRSVSSVTLTGFGTSSPMAANPRRAALLSRAQLDDGVEGTFRFTPSGNSSSRRAVTVAVRARGQSRDEAARTAMAAIQIAPSAYNLGVAVGWKRFALSGDIARLQGSVLPENRESAEIGLSYSGNRWNTRVELGADRAIGDRPRMLGEDEVYSVGLGGSYSLTRNLELTGGVRYRLQRDRLDTPQLDTLRDSQAVYVGTAFKF